MPLFSYMTKIIVAFIWMIVKVITEQPILTESTLKKMYQMHFLCGLKMSVHKTKVHWKCK